MENQDFVFRHKQEGALRFANLLNLKRLYVYLPFYPCMHVFVCLSRLSVFLLVILVLVVRLVVVLLFLPTSAFYQ